MQTQGVPEKKSLLQLCGVYPVTLFYRKPMNKRQGKTIKRGCQHPSNKFEILWQVAQNFFSPLLLYFVTQYVLIIVA